MTSIPVSGNVNGSTGYTWTTNQPIGLDNLIDLYKREFGMQWKEYFLSTVKVEVKL